MGTAVNGKNINRQAFRQGNEWLANLLVADYDPEVEPPVHGQNLCHDAEAYFNPEARLFIPDRAHPVPKRGNREVNSLIVRCCEETGENISQPVFLTVLHSDVLPAVNPLEQYV